MKKILLIDDDELVRDYIKACLVDWGYEMIDSGDGDSGIEMAVLEMPDLILMDINMPGTNGYEAIGRLRDDQQTRELPIIALTANNTAEDRDQAYEMGCKAYVAKPIVDTDILREAVMRCLPD